MHVTLLIPRTREKSRYATFYYLLPCWGTMAKYSVHFVLAGGSSYRDLAPVFESILKNALTTVDQMLEDEDMEMVVQNNVHDLKADKKPEGYLRKARIRMVFPIDPEKKEFYFQSYNSKLVDLSMIAKNTKAILDGAGIKYDYSEDDAITFDINPKKR